MKKIITSLSLLSSIIFLAACQNQKTADETEKAEMVTVTLTVQFEDKEETKDISVEKDDSVMDILEEHHTIEEESGMVTAIDGVAQDEAAKTYWMYDVNGELAPKGAEEMTVAEGDKIVFYLKTFE